MTKRLIEVDVEQLSAVRDVLGTQGLEETVGGAFDEVLNRRRRQLLAEREADADPLSRLGRAATF